VPKLIPGVYGRLGRLQEYFSETECKINGERLGVAWTRVAVSDRIWGVVPGLQSAWEALQRGDFLFFYAKAPASRIFGTGIVRDKFRQDRPLWVDEIDDLIPSLASRHR